jgi:hypothetical protein
MLSAERLERILRCPCGWRGGPVPCEAPTRNGGQPAGLANSAKKLKRCCCGGSASRRNNDLAGPTGPRARVTRPAPENRSYIPAGPAIRGRYRCGDGVEAALCKAFSTSS